MSENIIFVQIIPGKERTLFGFFSIDSNMKTWVTGRDEINLIKLKLYVNVQVDWPGGPLNRL